MSTSQVNSHLVKPLDQKKSKVWITFINIVLLVFTVGFVIYGIHQNIFLDQHALSSFIKQFGFWAPMIFILYQGAQVIFPILPGNLGCIVGVIIFGPWFGFLYNYIGIVGGSLISFWLSRRYGLTILQLLFKPEFIEKYLNKISNQKKFDTYFALAILLPVAPDDFLCYLAGLTKMSYRKYFWILVLAKPMGIIAYSYTLSTIFHYLLPTLL